MYIPKNRWFCSQVIAKIVKFTYSKSMNSVKGEVVEVILVFHLVILQTNILLNIFHLHQRIFFVKYCNRVFKVYRKFHNISKKTDFRMNYLNFTDRCYLCRFGFDSILQFRTMEDCVIFRMRVPIFAHMRKCSRS